jgi:hypothetical protein
MTRYLMEYLGTNGLLTMQIKVTEMGRVVWISGACSTLVHKHKAFITVERGDQRNLR